MMVQSVAIYSLCYTSMHILCYKSIVITLIILVAVCSVSSAQSSNRQRIWWVRGQLSAYGGVRSRQQSQMIIQSCAGAATLSYSII